jgi:hypothetical protein
MSSEELKPCPFCGGDVSFHKDEECPGCHLVQCGQCRAFFDFATGADPGNDYDSVGALRAAIAPMWNTRAQLAAIQGGMGEVVEVVAHRLVNTLGEVITEWQDGPAPEKFTSHCGVVQTDVRAELAYSAESHQRITAAMAAEVQTWKQLHADAQELYADAMIAIGKELGIDVSDEPRCKHVSAQAMAMAAEVERLSRMLNNATNDGIKLADERDALRAELAEVKGRYK